MRRPYLIPLRRPMVPHIGQRSYLASPRERNSIFRHWQMLAEQQQASFGSAIESRQIASQNSRVIDRNFPGGFHPFKLYQTPIGYRKMPGDPNDYGVLVQDRWWRCWRVRGGWAMGSDATATDASNSDADADIWPATTDILVPENCKPLPDASAFLFWVEIGSDIVTGHPTAVVRWGRQADAIAGSYTSLEYPGTYNGSMSPTGNNWTSSAPWTNCPWPDSSNVTIGTVDTFSYISTPAATVRQYLRHDISAVGAGSNCPYG